MHTKHRAASESFRAESLGASRFTLRGDLLPSSVTSGRHSYDAEAFVGSFGEHAFLSKFEKLLKIKNLLRFQDLN